MDSTFVLYVVGAIVLLAVLWLLTRQGKRSIGEIQTVVESLVAAAEQVLPGVAGEDKLEWVLLRADELGVTKYVSPALLRVLIEASVWWGKQTQPRVDAK